MKKFLLGAALTAVALLAFSLPAAHAAGEKFAVYGADTTEAERQELARIFGIDGATPTNTVTTPEMVAALRGTGLPAAPRTRASPARCSPASIAATG